MSGTKREPPRQPRQKTSGLPPLFRKEGSLILIRHERQHRHRACPLNSLRQTPLVLCRNSRYTTRHDLSAFGDKLPEQVYVLPIEIIGNDLSRTPPLVTPRAVADNIFANA